MRQTSRIAKAAAPCAAVLIAALWLLPVQAQDILSGATLPAMPSAPSMSSDPGASELKELPVPFMHNEHNKRAKITKCATCHHPLPGVKPVKGKKNMERRCADCHHERPAPNDRAASLMVVSHKLCQDCHKAQNKGPVNCSGCHKAESQPAASPAPASQSLVPSDGLFPAIGPAPMGLPGAGQPAGN
jgi:hypothetical protein